MSPPQSIPPAVLAALAGASERHHVPVRLLLGLAWALSGFEQRRRGENGELGIFQLTPGRAAALGVNALELAAAADGAARLLLQHYDRFGSWESALAAYLWGARNVQRKAKPDQWPTSVRAFVMQVWEAGQSAPIPFLGPVWVLPLSGAAATRRPSVVVK